MSPYESWSDIAVFFRLTCVLAILEKWYFWWALFELSSIRSAANKMGVEDEVAVAVASVLFATLVIGVIAAVGYVVHVAQSAPSVKHLRTRVNGGSTQVFAANGTRLGFIQSDELRSPVGWSEIPEDVKNATVAIEDQRFYKNDGVDLTGIFRAAVKDVVHGSALQGASTITMQLMRNLYLGGDQHTLKQKITEAAMAVEYSKEHSKRSILTSYLNSVPYGTLGGQTAVGVQAAARDAAGCFSGGGDPRRGGAAIVVDRH